MHKRGIALIIAAVFLLGGCESKAVSQSQSPLQLPLTAKTLTLATQTDLSEIAQQSLQYLVDKTAELSDGALLLDVVASEDPIVLLDGGSDLLFAPNEVIARANGNFLSYSSPFYFFDYNHLSLSLNSESFQKLTNETTRSLLGAEPLGALYDGNSMLLTIRSEVPDSPDALEGMKFYLEENELQTYLFEEFGAEVVERSLDERIEGFNSGRYHSIECDTLALERIELPPKGHGISAYESFQRARINWVMLSVETKANLTEWEQAILSEAMAYLIAQNDGAVRAAEQRGYEHLRALDGTIMTVSYGEFSEAADRILIDSSWYNGLWDWTLHEAVREIGQ